MANNQSNQDDKSASGTTAVRETDTTVETKTEEVPEKASTEQTTAPAQPVTQPAEAPPGVVQYADTLTVAELPSAESFEQQTVNRFLLPGRSDASHEMSKLQMGMVVGYITDNVSDPVEAAEDDGKWSVSDSFLTAVNILRNKALRGAQKDWNICRWIANQSWALTAHESMTQDQLTMLYGVILPALVGESKHWAPNIQAKIQATKQEHRDILVSEILKLHTRGDVSIFMAKFEGKFGRPDVSQDDTSRTQYQNQAPVQENKEEPF